MLVWGVVTSILCPHQFSADMFGSVHSQKNLVSLSAKNLNRFLKSMDFHQSCSMMVELSLKGNVVTLFRKHNITNIRSSPYYPQSLGKVEKCHQSMKKKIMYDLRRNTKSGVNWAENLNSYQILMKDHPKKFWAGNLRSQFSLVDTKMGK